jgi:hypothetical protein
LAADFAGHVHKRDFKQKAARAIKILKKLRDTSMNRLTDWTWQGKRLWNATESRTPGQFRVQIVFNIGRHFKVFVLSAFTGMVDIGRIGSCISLESSPFTYAEMFAD